jgi:hypothetical protein
MARWLYFAGAGPCESSAERTQSKFSTGIFQKKSPLMSSNFNKAAPEIIRQLTANRKVFEALLSNTPEAVYRWRPAPEKWSLLEIVCHLYDEEREDFRARVQHVLEQPDQPMPPIDPVGWVTARRYAEQDFAERLDAFLSEREQSARWLQSLTAPKWENTYEHPALGTMPAKLFLANWLAHDHLHIRQITRVKYRYLEKQSGQNLSYAGTW